MLINYVVFSNILFTGNNIFHVYNLYKLDIENKFFINQYICKCTYWIR